MRKHFLLLILAIIVGSCSLENSRIRNGLKASIPESQRKEYKLKSFDIIETILDANLRDSISDLHARIMTNEMSMERDSASLAETMADIAHAQHLKSTTLSFLRSSYDNIIDTYKDIEQETRARLETKESENEVFRKRIEDYNMAIEASKSPIIFYKVRHNYTLYGATKEDIVTLDSNYQPLNEF